MKYTVFAFLLLYGIVSKGQTLTVTIDPPDAKLCLGMRFTFHALIATDIDTGTVDLIWMKDNQVITDSTRQYLAFANVTFADTGYYRCIAVNGIISDTSIPAHLQIYPVLIIDTLYRYNELGCPGVCKGQFKTHISGGNPPYSYSWGGGHSQDTIVFGLCPGYHTLTVKDSDESYCITRKYFVDVLKLPKIEITRFPKDTVYLTNPTLKVSFPDSSRKYLNNWEWNFGDSAKIANVNPAQHDYIKTGTFMVKLNFTDQNGCDTTISDSLIVRLVNLVFPSVFTPNGDGHNEKFEIKEKSGSGFKSIDLMEVYLSNVLVIFNRWGKKVYEKTNYLSGEWDGDNLSDGVYYYFFRGHGRYDDEVYKGSVTILR
ncbi:MAG: gliding motility-associated C-terminal domain-containing protein [Bacteroidetes bacterium]|nr:gliding motility-associated C-terminal domain-containing protein [Bacteroidota bacterium]